jgi:hypothetical protein
MHGCWSRGRLPALSFRATAAAHGVHHRHNRHPFGMAISERLMALAQHSLKRIVKDKVPSAHRHSGRFVAALPRELLLGQPRHHASLSL